MRRQSRLILLPNTVVAENQNAWLSERGKYHEEPVSSQFCGSWAPIGLGWRFPGSCESVRPVQLAQGYREKISDQRGIGN